jgi:plasmid stabilization system protein ParE
MQAERAAASLDLFPYRGRRVTEYRDEAVRELFVSSYRLIYRVSATRISIIAFVHKARDLSRLMQNDRE